MTYERHRFVIVGAGFGGMGIALQLRRLGYDDILILDRNDDLGGTWHVNRYPGLTVDIPSVTYSFSFEPNPGWSRWYAPGPEIERYCHHVADTYDLRRHMRFGTAVEGARWDEETRSWHVALADGGTVEATYLITATGFLSQPRTPDIEGIESFAGTVLHSAEWPEDTDLTGRRVAVIGTGATGVQLIPELARDAAHLTVFQRTPIWVTPKVDFDIPSTAQRAFARAPITQHAARLVNAGVLETLLVSVLVLNQRAPWLVKSAERLARRHLRRQVPDPELRRKLTPDYDFGCKRPTFSNTYYPTFMRDDVDLVTEPIAAIEPGAVVLEDGSRVEVDTLVLATGYSIWERNFPAIEVIGRDGRDLGKTWRDEGFTSYEGIAMPGFPNFLTTAAPYSYSGLSFFRTIEAQMKHVDRLFGELRRRGAEVFEPTQAATDAFVARMRRSLEHSVWRSGDCATARSYYFDPHGEPTLARAGSTLGNHRDQAGFDLADYAYA